MKIEKDLNSLKHLIRDMIAEITERVEEGWKDENGKLVIILSSLFIIVCLIVLFV